MEYTTALVAVGLTSFLMLVIEVNYTYATQGTAFGWSANRPNVEFTQLAQRIKNAYGNQVESTAYTVPVLAAAALMGLEHAGAEMAAIGIVVGRGIYGPLYYSGIPFARLVGFGIASLSTAYLLVVLILNL